MIGNMCIKIHVEYCQQFDENNMQLERCEMLHFMDEVLVVVDVRTTTTSAQVYFSIR